MFNTDEKEKILRLNKFEEGVLINALNDRHNELLKEKRPTDAIDELLMKAIKAPVKKVCHEAR